MAFAYIREYLRQPRDGVSSIIPAGQEPALATQRVAIGGGSTQSAPFNPKTTFVAINVDVTCSLAFGDDPTATTTDMRLPQDATQYFGVRAGDKVAFISNS
jgi:hypothetical protein